MKNTTKSLLDRTLIAFPGMIFDNFWYRLLENNEKETINSLTELLRDFSRNVDDTLPTPEEDPDLHKKMELIGIGLVSQIYDHYPETMIDEYIFQYVRNMMKYRYTELAHCAWCYLLDREDEIVAMIIKNHLGNQIVEFELDLYEEDEFYHTKIIDLFYTFRNDKETLQKHQELFWYVADIVQDLEEETDEKFETLLTIFYSFRDIIYIYQKESWGD